MTTTLAVTSQCQIGKKATASFAEMINSFRALTSCSQLCAAYDRF